MKRWDGKGWADSLVPPWVIFFLYRTLTSSAVTYSRVRPLFCLIQKNITSPFLLFHKHAHLNLLLLLLFYFFPQLPAVPYSVSDSSVPTMCLLVCQPWICPPCSPTPWFFFFLPLLCFPLPGSYWSLQLSWLHCFLFKYIKIVFYVSTGVHS